MVPNVILMMFSENMVDYPMSFLSLSTVEGTIQRHSYSLSFFVGPFLHASKLWVGWGGLVVAPTILVSAQGPFVLGFWLSQGLVLTFLSRLALSLTIPVPVKCKSGLILISKVRNEMTHGKDWIRWALTHCNCSSRRRSHNLDGALSALRWVPGSWRPSSFTWSSPRPGTGTPASSGTNSPPDHKTRWLMVRAHTVRCSLVDAQSIKMINILAGVM